MNLADPSCSKPVKVYVGGHLPNHITSSHIRDHFKAYEGDIIDVTLMRNMQTKQTLGFAVVTFSSRTAAQDAIEKMDGSLLGGTIRIKVEEKHDRRRPHPLGEAERGRRSPGDASHEDAVFAVTIDNLNNALAEVDLRCVLESMDIHYNRCNLATGGTGTKSAVLEFSSLSDAERVVCDLNGKNLLGQRVDVSITPHEEVDQSCNQRQSVTVKVLHIPPSLTKEMLEVHFKQVGEVAGSKIHWTNNPYAHVHFKNQDGAKLAVERLNRSQIDGHSIGVKLYSDRDQVPPPRRRGVEQRSPLKNQGPPFTDQGPSFRDQGPPFKDQGPSFRDQGPPFKDQGPSYRDQGPPFRDQGPSFRDQGPPFRDQGPSFRDQGPPFRDQRPPFRDQGPPFRDQGPPFRDQGPSFRDQGPSFRDQGPSFRDQRPSFSDQGPSCRDHGPKQRSLIRTNLELHTPELFQAVDKSSDHLLELPAFHPSTQVMSQPSNHERLSQMGQDINSMKVVITCSPEQWNRLLTVDAGGNSLFQELCFPFKSNPNVHIQPVYEKQVIIITGASEAVVTAKEYVEKGLPKDISMDNTKMAAMLHFFPNLRTEMLQQFGVRLLGYAEGSTVVQFDGAASSAIKDARQLFEAQLKRILFDSVQLPCIQLIPSANRRLENERLQVFVTQTTPSTSTVQLCGCESTQMDRAMRVLKSKPIENYVEVSTGDLSYDLRDKISGLEATHGVAIVLHPNKVIITSYIKDDTHAARQVVERLVAEMAELSVPLKCSQQFHLYMYMVLIKNPTEEGKVLVSSLRPAEISFRNREIFLTGTRQAVQQAQEKLQSCILSDLQHRDFKFHCNSRFLSQIKQYVLATMKGQEKLDFVYFDDMPKRKPGSTAEAKEFSIAIFSRIPDHFSQICRELEGLKPFTKRCNLKQGSADIVKGLINESIESKYRARVVIANQQGEVLLLIHALTGREAENCWVELEEGINSTLVIEKNIPLSHMQVRYLEAKCKSQLQNMKKNCLEVLIPRYNKEEHPTMKVKGTVNQVSIVEENLKELFQDEYYETEFEVVSGKSLLEMWKKRWQQIKVQQEQLLDILIEFDPKVSRPDQSCATVAFMICGNDKDGIEQVKTMICTKECKDFVKKKTIQLPSSSSTATISKELKSLELDQLNVVISVSKTTNSVTITAPEQTSDDLSAAEEVIRKHVGDSTLKTENITYSEPVLGLIFASESGKQLGLAEKFDSVGMVSVRFLKPPQIGVSVSGVQSAIDAAKPKVQQILKEVLQDISEVSFNVSGQYSVLLASGELSHFLAKLKTDQAVLCTFPATSQHMNKTIHSIPIKPTVSAHCVKFELVQGNLVNESVSALVNAANEKLEHIGGLAKAISDAGGPSIQADSNAHITKNGKLKEGDAVCLDSGDLPCRKLIHAVGPRWKGGSQNEETVLYFTVQKVLKLADKESLESIALPALSCGVFGVPEEICARATLKSIRDFCQANPSSNIHTIRCVLYDQPVLRAFCEQLKTYFPVSGVEVSQDVIWQWQDDKGSFSPYSSVDSDKLSDQYGKDPQAAFSLVIGKHTYLIDLSSMVQTNLKTNKQRRIQRATSSCLPSLQAGPMQAQWCYLGDNGQLVPYTPHDSSAIQSMYLNKVPGVLTMNNTAYTFDFSTMHQINVATKYRRTIKFQMMPGEAVVGSASGNSYTVERSASGRALCRDIAITLRGLRDSLEGAKSALLSKLKNSFSSKTVPLPCGECNALERKLIEIADRHQVTYSSAMCPTPTAGGKAGKELKIEGLTSAVLKTVTAIQEEIISYQASTGHGETVPPPEWQPQTKTTELFTLPSGSKEWNHVVQKFQQTMAHAPVISVHRIQNKWLWDRYVKHKERLHLKNSGVVNEMELFHGTRNNDPKLIYEGEDGFDMRYSAEGMWGMANYFAVNASYSDSYAHHITTSRQKEMFLVKVLTGDSYNCAPNSSLRMPPPKPSGGTGASQVQLGQMKYDTVTGTTNGSQVFMAYDNEKAYPAYLITYTQ